MLGKEDDGRWVEELCASSSLFLKHQADRSKWSFCVLWVSMFLMPAVLCLLMMLLPFRESVAMQTACSLEIFESLTLGKQASVDSNSFIAEKQTISFLQTVPGILLCAKRPSSCAVQNLFYLGLVVVCSWDRQASRAFNISCISILTLDSDFVQSCGKSLEL